MQTTLYTYGHRTADEETFASRLVDHLVGAARQPHRPTDGVRRDGDALVYDAGQLRVELRG